MKQGKPNKAWLGTYHKKFGLVEDRVYDLPDDWDFKLEPMFQEVKGKPAVFDKQEKQEVNK